MPGVYGGNCIGYLQHPLAGIGPGSDEYDPKTKLEREFHLEDVEVDIFRTNGEIATRFYGDGRHEYPIIPWEPSNILANCNKRGEFNMNDLSRFVDGEGNPSEILNVINLQEVIDHKRADEITLYPKALVNKVYYMPESGNKRRIYIPWETYISLEKPTVLR